MPEKESYLTLAEVANVLGKLQLAIPCLIELLKYGNISVKRNSLKSLSKFNDIDLLEHKQVIIDGCIDVISRDFSRSKDKNMAIEFLANMFKKEWVNEKKQVLFFRSIFF